MDTPQTRQLDERLREADLEREIARLDEATAGGPSSGDARARWTHAYLLEMLDFKRDRLERLRGITRRDGGRR